MQTIPLPSWLLRLYQLLFLLLPWTVEANFGAWNLSIPAEPLIAMVGLGLALVLARQRTLPPGNRLKTSGEAESVRFIEQARLNFWLVAGSSGPKIKRSMVKKDGALWPLEVFRRFLRSGLVWISLTWMLWQAVAAGFSSMPGVSWKYWLVEAGHWWVFFVGLLCWPELWQRLFRLFFWSMLGVVLYTVVHHGFYHFRADQALLAPMPFFADHTVYSVVLGMLVFYLHVKPSPGLSLPEDPILFKFEKGLALKLLKLVGLGLGLIALLLATSRAAWLSILLSSIAGLVLYFRPRPRWLILSAVLTFSTGLFFQEKITTYLANDPSSQERLNRYACALRLAGEQPWMGFGPGTYQFQYLPFQKPEEMTRISRSEPIEQRGPDNYGRGGGAHSEYLQALAELGWPGFLLWLLLVIFSLSTGIRNYQQTRALVWLFLSLGLLSFFLHGLVNNFLHDGRVAALVWGGVAAVAAKFKT